MCGVNPPHVTFISLPLTLRGPSVKLALSSPLRSIESQTKLKELHSWIDALRAHGSKNLCSSLRGMYLPKGAAMSYQLNADRLSPS